MARLSNPVEVTYSTALPCFSNRKHSTYLIEIKEGDTNVLETIGSYKYI